MNNDFIKKKGERYKKSDQDGQKREEKKKKGTK